MDSFSLTDDVYSLFHLQQCLSLCQPFSIPMLIIVYDINAFNINNYYIHYHKNLFAHKCYCYAYDSSFSASMLDYTNAHA